MIKGKKIGSIVFLFFFPWIAFADNQQVSLAIDQTVFSLTAQLEESITLEINVSNLLDKKQKIFLEISDLLIEDNNELKLILKENEFFGMKEWFLPKKEEWVFEPKETKKISLEIKIPKNTKLGSHYAGIFFQALPENESLNILTGVRLGSYVLLNIIGANNGAGKIIDFQAPLLIKKETELKVEFKNLGSIHYVPFGEIILRSIFLGKTRKIEAEKHFVFPNKKYFFNNSWLEGSDWGIYWARARFIDGNQKEHFADRLIFGKFSFFWLVLAGMIFFIGKKIKKHYIKK